MADKAGSASDDDEIDLTWGEPILGRKKSGRQLYSSCVMDGVRYELYDCVFCSSDEGPPYLGKIIQMGTWDGEDMMRLQWFFYPKDVIVAGGELPADMGPKEVFLSVPAVIMGVADDNPVVILGSGTGVTFIPTRLQCVNDQFVVHILYPRTTIVVVLSNTAVPRLTLR